MNRVPLISARNLLFRRPIENIPTMKLRYTALATVLAGSSAWLQAPLTNRAVSRGAIQHTYPKLTVRLASDSALRALAVPEEVGTTSALTPTGKSIAEGSVVSFFRGGLVAVRLDDDDVDLLGPSPEVIDTTNSLPNKPKPSNLSGDLIGRQVVFSSGRVGVVVTHRPPLVFVYADIDGLEDVEGTVTVLNSLASVDVSEEIKSCDCFGRVLEGVISPGEEAMKRPIFAPIPQLKDIALINSPLITGVTMFDALAPIGNGQNMLMIGHDIEDMRRYACDMLSIQKGNTKCIYAATGNKEEVTQMLGEAALLDDIVLVSGDDNGESDNASKAAEATMIAATAIAIGESFALEKGMDTLVVVDNIDQHKQLWDTTTRVLVDVFGIDSVVKGESEGASSSEMRAFFSSLVQRSARYKSKRGGGSVTLLLLTTIPKMSGTDEDAVYSPKDFEGSPAKVRERIELLVEKNIPLTAGNLRKIRIPIPSDTEGRRRLSLQHVDELISMSDGQIWLDEELEEAGRRPAMDFQRSVTRIGIGADTESQADAPAMRRVVQGLRLDLSQALDMDGADVGISASKKQMRTAKAWLLAMHQPSASGARRLSESCAVMLAASRGYLNDSVENDVHAGTPEGEKLLRDLLDHVKVVASAAMAEVDSSQDFTETTKEAIEDAIKSFFS